jgi:hypothetical protein
MSHAVTLVTDVIASSTASLGTESTNIPRVT